MSLKTAIATAATVVLLLCTTGPGFSSEATPVPQRASALTATTMEQKLYQDIKDAKQSGRDTTKAEKLKAKGDAELKEGRIRPAIRHYQAAEKALNAAK